MFGLLDDIDRQDVKDFLNSAVDNTADLYNTVTEYDYENMFDDIGDYFRGLLSDEPESRVRKGGGQLQGRIGSQMADFVSRGGGRPAPESITKTTVSVSPGTQPMVMPQRIKDAEMRRRGAEDIRLQYPEFDMMMQMNRPRRTTVAPAEEAVVNPGGYKTLAERSDAYPLPEYLRRRVRDQVRNDTRISAAQAAADAQIGNALRQRYMPSINSAPNPFPLL